MNAYKTSRATIRSATPNQRFVYVLESENPEVALSKEARTFFDTVGYSEIFPNFKNLRIGTVHPFAILLAQDVLDQPKTANIFPSITIADSSGTEDADVLNDEYVALNFKEQDIAKLGGYRDAGDVYVSDSGWQRILETVAASGNIVGIRKSYHFKHTLDFNIWSDNKEITSFIYDMVCHFLIQKKVDIHRDHSIDFGPMNGRRSGDVNLDFGMLLYGANVQINAMIHYSAVLFDTGILNIGSVDTQTLPTYFAMQGGG